MSVLRVLLLLVLLALAFAPRWAEAQTPCPQSVPGLTPGGTSFGANSAQWQSFFGAKLDATSTALGCLLAQTVAPGVTSLSANCGVTATPSPIHGAGSVALGPGKDQSPSSAGLDPTYVEFALAAQLTSSITWTLPSAAAVPRYCRLAIVDRVGGITGGFTISVVPQGTDYIDALRLQPVKLDAPHSVLILESDGVANWTIVLQYPNPAAVDARVFGVVADNATDNAVPFQRAVSWAVSSGNTLILPPGKIYVSGGATATLPAGGSFTMRGMGAENSFLRGTGTLLTINKASGDVVGSFHVRDFTCLAGGANTGTCIDAVAQGNITNPAVTAASDVSGVTFRGSDGYAATNCWGNDFTTNYWSNVTFTNDSFVGCSGNAGVGINLAGGTNSSTTGVIFNIRGCNFVGKNIGLLYGPYAQGVTVTGGSNFTANNVGIYVPASELLTAQLTVTDSQFGIASGGTAGIQDLTGVPTEIIKGNTFVVQDNATGVDVACSGCVIEGNTFGGTGVNTVAVNVPSGGNAVVQGNQSATIKTGLVVGSTVINLREIGNAWRAAADVGVTAIVNFAADGRSNFISCCGPQDFLVTGAVSGTGGFTELTLSPSIGTNTLNTGNSVVVQGIVGVPANGVWPLTIVDSTHVLLSGNAFSGSYSSGGVVSLSSY